MKIAFVNMRRDIYPPLGICYLSSYLKERMPSVETRVVELVYGDDGKKNIKSILHTNPAVVGISTYTVGYHEVVHLCKELRSVRPDLIIWLGGPHITSLPHTLPLHADVGILGEEGEETCLELRKK